MTRATPGLGADGAAPFLSERPCALQSREAASSRLAVVGGSPTTSHFAAQGPTFWGFLPRAGSALLICAAVEDDHSIKIFKWIPH